ncbi:MAG: efflux RND transporter periplasmic adaptor subunit [Acidobacteria bacterium]|nr:efflux RND transporter periplasmic adaptor subunit [Acidobacteriota bacterium]
MKRWGIGLGALAAIVAVTMALRGNGGEGIAVDIGVVETRETFRSYVTASGEIVAERYADIGSSVMGRVVDLPVIEGQTVTRDDLLARIDPVQARSDLDAASAAIAALEAEAKAAEEQVGAARADLQLAEARAREAEANFNRTDRLHEQELVSRAELDTAVAALETARAQVASAEAAVARVVGSASAAERRVAQAEAQAARAEDQLSKTSIVSPIDGVVSRLQVRQDEMVVIGIQNQPGTVLMTVSDLSELNADVKVAEADVLRVAVGQPATITLEALPGRTFTGRVTEVGASALPQEGAGAAAREFRVEVRIDDHIEGMRPGLTCDAEILVGEEANVATVPLQAVVLRPAEDGTDRRGVFVVQDGQAQFREVETGIIGGLDIGIGGLDAGTEVIIGPYQVLRDLQDGDAVRPQ